MEKSLASHFAGSAYPHLRSSPKIADCLVVAEKPPNLATSALTEGAASVSNDIGATPTFHASTNAKGNCRQSCYTLKSCARPTNPLS